MGFVMPMHRRDFLRLGTGSSLALGFGGRLSAAETDARALYAKFVPHDKQLDAAWVESLTRRGHPLDAAIGHEAGGIDPEVIGMSAIAGLLEPVTRLDRHGLHVRLAPPEDAPILLDTPIAPGYMRDIGIESYTHMTPGKIYRPDISDGSIALDGERELSFTKGDNVTIELVNDAFRTVNVSACMQYAARHGLMRIKQDT